MLVENMDLCYRFIKIRKFFDSPTYNELPENERALINIQYGAMLSYAHALKMRIEIMKKKQ